MIGFVGNSSTGDQTFFVGLAWTNATNFSWRMKGFLGFAFYMKGEYSEFQNTTQAIFPRLLREKHN
jgi:hypothetical protein